jgi:hypothetical protein
MRILTAFCFMLVMGLPAATAQMKEDPDASKLLANARAARAVWENFPGFSADLEVNANGMLYKGLVRVDAKGKVNVILDAADLKDSVRRDIASLVAHRLPGGPSDTPCAFTDDPPHHPQGRIIKVLNDELHSSYRIRDRQILEVNRTTGDVRFTITVLENIANKEKQFLPVFYMVNTWDTKTKALKSSVSHHHTWTRIGHFDLPVTVQTVRASAEPLDSRVIRFANHKLESSAR